MESMLKVGNEIDMKEAAGPLADAVCRVLAEANESHSDREVTLKALEVLGMAATAAGSVTVTNCTFDNSNAQPF